MHHSINKIPLNQWERCNPWILSLVWDKHNHIIDDHKQMIKRLIKCMNYEKNHYNYKCDNEIQYMKLWSNLLSSLNDMIIDIIIKWFIRKFWAIRQWVATEIVNSVEYWVMSNKISNKLHVTQLWLTIGNNTNNSCNTNK